MPKNTKFDREMVVDAIRGAGQFTQDGEEKSSFGIVKNVAERLQVTRATVYSYMNRWSTVEDAMTDERNAFLDICESKLADAVMEGDITAIKFALRTLGRDRGYAEKIEHGVGASEGAELHIYIPDNGRD
jgi:hypothetical protein